MMGKNTKIITVPLHRKTSNTAPSENVAITRREDSKRKKKRKFIPAKPKEENKSQNLKKILADFKRPKETVSSNWLAFKNSGLYEEAKKQSIDSKPKGKWKPHWKTFKGKTNHTPATKSADSPQKQTSVIPQDEALENPDIAELAAKSDAEKKELTHCIAMDCEMVGVDDGKESVLARISLVNQHGECIYDKFVKPKEEVADYRTHVSGVRPSDLKKGEEFEVVQKEVASILSGRILVGHALRNDLKVLLLNHPPKMIRDTSRFKPFRNINNGRSPALKKLAAEILGVTIQTGEHSSVEDAKATMQLYNLYQKEWEDHRLQKKLLRKRKAIAAAVGPLSDATSKRSKKKSTAVKVKNPYMDEFVAF